VSHFRIEKANLLDSSNKEMQSEDFCFVGLGFALGSAVSIFSFGGDGRFLGLDLSNSNFNDSLISSVEICLEVELSLIEA